CQAVEQQYVRLKTRQFGSLNLDYLSKLYRFGEESLFQRADGRFFSGTIVGVTPAGRLSIEIKNSGGLLEDFDLKEVKFVLI
ncbi:MAG: biotin--[acetyl-CoA-carboxylase] ligase, partial [Saprospiraceae bacterium]|nr:biotin--[acetyl-CoA-carboxylase] ligase [Saprospiraceae bacterium]